MSSFLYPVLCGYLWTLVLGQDCPYKECYCGYQVIFCNQINLQEMPHLINATVEFQGTLNLDVNTITTIPARSLPLNLTGISLQSNPVETIDDTAFDELLDTMESVTFSGARFTQIPNALLRLNALKTLDISNTNILFWNDTGMRHLGSAMETLILNTVGLTTWPTWIQSYSHLRELSISGSSITSIPDEGLDQVSETLRSLELHSNSLTAIPKTLATMTALGSLSLHLNKITDITWLPQMCKLNWLSLHNNRISDAALLADVLLLHGDTLENFDIYSNHLTAIPDMPYFKMMPELDFSDNHISDPDSGSVRNDVSKLKLDNNLLPSIPRIMKTLSKINNVVILNNRITAIRATDYLNSTTELNLGYNLITELTDTSFPENSNIVVLFLNNNPLSKISDMALQNLPQLSRLYIQYTKITRLPLGIAFLSNLYIMDFTGSAGLVCTCLEKSLETRIGSLRSYNALGECGEMKIFTFFTELSKDCPPLDDF